MTTTKNSEQPIVNEAELVTFLKQCVVAKDKLKLKSKLGETITLRRKLLRQNNDEFADFMAFYFADTEFVSVHFKILICTIVFLQSMYFTFVNRMICHSDTAGISFELNAGCTLEQQQPRERPATKLLTVIRIICPVFYQLFICVFFSWCTDTARLWIVLPQHRFESIT